MNKTTYWIGGLLVVATIIVVIKLYETGKFKKGIFNKPKKDKTDEKAKVTSSNKSKNELKNTLVASKDVKKPNPEKGLGGSNIWNPNIASAKGSPKVPVAKQEEKKPSNLSPSQQARINARKTKQPTYKLEWVMS